MQRRNGIFIIQKGNRSALAPICQARINLRRPHPVRWAPNPLSSCLLTFPSTPTQPKLNDVCVQCKDAPRGALAHVDLWD